MHITQLILTTEHVPFQGIRPRHTDQQLYQIKFSSTESYLCNSQDAIHSGLSGSATFWLQITIQTRKVEGYKAGHGQPQQQHVACFPSLQCVHDKRSCLWIQKQRQYTHRAIMIVPMGVSPLSLWDPAWTVDPGLAGRQLPHEEKAAWRSYSLLPGERNINEYIHLRLCIIYQN